MASLRGCRQKNFKGLVANVVLREAFDDLLDITGVWDDMMLTTVQKIVGFEKVSRPDMYRNILIRVNRSVQII